MDAQSLKAQANQAFGKGKFCAAADLYTEAITLCAGAGQQPASELVSFVSTLHSNRALAYKALDRWAEVEEDARRAMELDRFNAKAHYLVGVALMRRHDFAGAHKSLLNGLDKATRKDPKGAVVAELASAVARCVAALAEARVAEQRAEDSQLHSYLLSLLPPPGGGAGGGGGGAGAVAASDDGDDARHAVERARLDELFLARERVRGDRRVPTWAECPISAEVMLDPVVTPAGHSYERGSIERYIDLKKEDPVSRSALRREDLVPNRALCEAVRGWLAEHPWAHPAVPYKSDVYDAFGQSP